jgi:hypothetical protein
MVWVSIIMELEEMANGGLGWADGVGSGTGSLHLLQPVQP